MDRNTEAKLLEFCKAQRLRFVGHAWMGFVADNEVNQRLLLTVALFLAGTEWFGHRKELVLVADELAGGQYFNLSKLVSENQFECGRFSNMLRRMIHE